MANLEEINFSLIKTTQDLSTNVSKAIILTCSFHPALLSPLCRPETRHGAGHLGNGLREGREALQPYDQREPHQGQKTQAHHIPQVLPGKVRPVYTYSINLAEQTFFSAALAPPHPL